MTLLVLIYKVKCIYEDNFDVQRSYSSSQFSALNKSLVVVGYLASQSVFKISSKIPFKIVHKKPFQFVQINTQF